jgi:hypothetical protein
MLQVLFSSLKTLRIQHVMGAWAFKGGFWRVRQWFLTVVYALLGAKAC